MTVRLLTYTPNPEKVVAMAARTCYTSMPLSKLEDKLTDEEVAKMVTKLSDMGHESPMEHASFTFAIEGVSRALLAQITRHRMASYSVRSQRYVKEADCDYVIPSSISSNPLAASYYNAALGAVSDAYDQLIKLGIPKEDARMTLPNATETQMMVTMNARSLHNFFHLRCCNRAQWEIRELADEMLKLCKEVAPILFAKAGAACTYGPCSEGAMSCGSPRRNENEK